MKPAIVQFSEGVTLVAGGPVRKADMVAALALAPEVVAADGGADRALGLGVEPVAVIGDMDSISDTARARLKGRLHPVAEQETTDFDKALRHISAPFILALGCLGGRLDHELAVLGALIRPQATPCLLIGRDDVVFHAPRVLELALRPGDRVSLFPMLPVTGRSEGLRWPIAGLSFTPDGRGGTSNMVEGAVRLEMAGPGMLVILPRNRLAQALNALVSAG